MDQSEGGLGSKTTRNHPELAQRVIALSCNQTYMLRENELMIKHDTEVADTIREGYVREERGEPENVNLCKLRSATKPYSMNLRGMER